MATTASQETKGSDAISPWQGFQHQVSGRTGSTFATSFSRTTRRTTATPTFSRRRRSARRPSGTQLTDLFVEERRKGVLDVSQIPSSITAHAPGYIDRENEIIVGLQTDAPLKRAIMPNGGFRMVATALKTYGYEPDPHVVEAFTKYRKTHNDGVFDAYTADVRRCRSSHILTGLPDAYGRGRIIGDYRRVALYGVARLIEHKQQEKASIDALPSTDEIIRDREELSEQIRALKELQKMAASYGFDISRPAATAKEAVQWLYFGYLAGVKEQNGAAMSLGRTTTFLDIYFERDLASGNDYRGAGAGDDRRLRHQAPHRPVPAHARVRRSLRRRSDLGHRIDWRHGRRRAIARDQDELPHPANALQPRPRPGTQPDDLVFTAAAGWVPALRRQGGHRHQLAAVRKRRDHAQRLGRRRGHRLLRVADDGRQADAVLRRQGQPRQMPALRDQRRDATKSAASRLGRRWTRCRASSWTSTMCSANSSG